MCLAVRHELLKKRRQGRRGCDGNRWNIRITLTPEIEVGDVVLVHAGYAIAKVDEDEAAKRGSCSRKSRSSTKAN